jgi:hypothetical protein
MMRHLDTLVKKAMPETNGRALSFVKFHTTGSPFRPFPKVLFFGFADSETAPIVVIKTVRAGKDNDVIERSFRRLSSAYELLQSEGEKNLFPQPIALEIVDGIAFGLERAVAGERGSQSDVGRVLSSYDTFLQATKHLSKKVDKLAWGASLIDSLRIPAKEREDMQKAWGALVSLSRRPKVTIVPQHGDFTLDNVMVSRDAVHLIDCDWFTKEGLAGADLFHFLQRASRLTSDLQDRMKTYLQKLGEDGTFDASDVFLWHICDMHLKRIQMSSDDAVSAQADFDKILRKLSLI